MTDCKFIWMSDPHMVARGGVLGHDPRARLRAAVAFINTHHSDARFCIISGDLVDGGGAEDYRALAAILKDLVVPVYPMVGNHDDRALLRAHLAVPPGGMTDFVQYAVPDLTGARILCLDTLTPGSGDGSFCAARLKWLGACLAESADPTYVFMHHPPFALELPCLDDSCNRDGAAMMAAFRDAPQIRHLFMGHIHQAITGRVGGIPFATMRAILYQAPPPEPPWDWENFAPALVPPALGVITLRDGDAILRYQDFCAVDLGLDEATRQNCP